jgi:hypothetical protein
MHLNKGKLEFSPDYSLQTKMTACMMRLMMKKKRCKKH